MSNSLPFKNTVDTETYLAFQALLYKEARLLDQEDYEQWLAMLADDIHYYMPVPARYLREEKKQAIKPLDAHIFNDYKKQIELRIARFATNLVWSENPQNAINHTVTNIEVFPTDVDGEWNALSVVTVLRSRLDGVEKRMVVSRDDIWRIEGDSLKLAKRNMLFNHTVVPDSNLNFFF
jgi:ethylbenzene dioxygenase beta subunit